jgi:HMG (high mobility group) box
MRKMTPFMIFYCEHKASIEAIYPNAPPAQISQLLSEDWRSLSPAKVKDYSLMASIYADNVEIHGKRVYEFFKTCMLDYSASNRSVPKT